MTSPVQPTPCHTPAIFHGPARSIGAGSVPFVLPTAEETPAAAEPQQAGLQTLLPMLVRQVAWNREGPTATVRLELGCGALAGAVILVTTDALSRVRVRIEAPQGVDADEWRERLLRRLERRGLDLVRE